MLVALQRLRFRSNCRADLPGEFFARRLVFEQRFRLPAAQRHGGNRAEHEPRIAQLAFPALPAIGQADDGEVDRVAQPELQVALFCAGGKRRNADLLDQLGSSRTVVRRLTAANNSSAGSVRCVVFIEAPSATSAGADIRGVDRDAAAVGAALRLLLHRAERQGLAVIGQQRPELDRKLPRLIAMERLER